MAPAWAPLTRHSVTTDAREHVIRLITTGAVKPGEKLPPERQLMERLGISRPALRESIAALTAMGILEARQGAGTFVSNLDPARIVEPLALIVNFNREVVRELFGVRSILEAGAIQLAATSISDEELAKLRGLVDDLAKAQGSVKRFLQLDIEFHRTIHRASHNQLLIALLEERGPAGPRVAGDDVSQRRGARECVPPPPAHPLGPGKPRPGGGQTSHARSIWPTCRA